MNINKCLKLVHQPSLSKVNKHSHLNLLPAKTCHSELMVEMQIVFPKSCLYWLSCFLHVKQWGKGKRQTLSQASHDFFNLSVQKYSLLLKCRNLKIPVHSFKFNKYFSYFQNNHFQNFSTVLLIVMPLLLVQRNSHRSHGPQNAQLETIPWQFIVFIINR